MMSFSETSPVFFDPVLPIPLLVLAGLTLAALTIYTYLQDRKSVGILSCLIFTLLRFFALLGIFFILLNPQHEVAKRIQSLEQRVIIAVDTSSSMAHADSGKTTRIDEAMEIIGQSGLIQSSLNGLDIYAFDDGARPVATKAFSQLEANGQDTRIHSSISTLLTAARNGQALAGIILLTDGHDFELVNPARTALDARNRQSPIYTLPIGSQTTVRDAAIHIASYKPYIFSGQHARIDVALRLIGCEYEDFTLELYREGKRIQQRHVAVGDELQRLESFEVVEDTPGQFAYEFRLSPVRNEVTLENNQATTFLNVSNKKINLLLVEGSPYWDTNFTLRSLWSNEKFMVDSVTAVAPGKQIVMRKDLSLGVLTLPETAEGFDAYDCVLLGKDVDRILNTAQQQALSDYVQNYGGTVIFMRGEPAINSESLAEISPMIWGKDVSGYTDLEVNRQGRTQAPFELLNLHSGQRTLQPVFGFQSGEARPLTTVLVGTQQARDSKPGISMAHRRSGLGQVMAIASTGFWRSGFHAELPDGASLFDQFWDNLILWMISARSPDTGSDYMVLLNTANLALDQTLHIRMSAASAGQLPAGLPIDLFKDGRDEPVDRIVLSQGENPNSLTGAYTPKEPGLYHATLALPDGSVETLRFAVYNNNREATEISVDRPYLERLAQQSGGRMIEREELGPLVRELLIKEEPEPLKQREPVWDVYWLALAIAGLLGLDWWIRRRSGLC